MALANAGPAAQFHIPPAGTAQDTYSNCGFQEQQGVITDQESILLRYRVRSARQRSIYMYISYGCLILSVRESIKLIG